MTARRVPLIALICSLALPALAEPLAEREALRRHWLEHRLPLAAGGGLAKPDDVSTFDMRRVEVQLDVPERGLPDEARFIVDVTLTAPVDDPVVPLAAVFFTPAEVTRGGQPLEFEHLPDEGLLLIGLPEVPSVGESISLTIDASLELDCGDPSTCITNGPLRHLVGLGWFPLSAEFPVSDRFIAALTFTGPEAIGVAATGVRQPVERLPDAVVRRFVTEQVTILPAFVIGDFGEVEFDRRVELFPPFTAPRPGLELGGVAASVVDFYADLLGPFPFARLGLSPLSSEAGVALGPQANILLPEAFWFFDPSDEAIWSTLAQTTAHEIGHQYFYNLVGILDEDEAWMSEAFAEYVATRYWEAVSGTQDHIRTNAWTYLYEVSPFDDAPVHSVEVNSSPNYFPIVYLKGSNLLNMLRWRLGPERFDAAMRSYIEAFAGQVTTTDEFREVLELETGEPLARFFEQWVERPGYPTLTVQVTPARRDGDAVQIAVRQSSDWGRFDGEIPVVLDLDDARQIDARVPLDGEASLPGEAVARLRIDPNLTVLRRVRPAERGDVDLSGVVDGKDLIDVRFNQGRGAPEPGFDDQLDVDDDGRIGRADERAILDAFGNGW